ncbi:hypothetical protein H8K90_10935 [Winogradskyella echinorum]|uniref:Uncharacterized protein n=1 Tax=Winogradskyella echinorum TaxID=538189 RepID=A0ABR6Y2B7_9FLAO|nr:hypothetical protein [Winogradskyella echinorum]MBC3846895.1 hypothetical protein [Winogradskyella echinorum]MBC5751243.1 hypothetical protein [Winogradskyella echinorum]
MRKSIVAFLCLFCSNLLLSNVYAQKQYLEITNLKNNRTKKIKEKKKITVYTNDLKKVYGPLKILDNETILIKETEIKLSDVLMIKNKSILVKIFSYVVLPVTMMLTIGILAVSGAGDSVTANIGVIGISAILATSQIKKKYKTERYKFKIAYD